MPSPVSIEVKGLIETQRMTEKVVQYMHGEPMLQAFRDSVLIVQRDAKIGTPVDTGRLRASITPEVRVDGMNVIGVVGSNVTYAPYVELGTRPHWPPIAALEVWARRHHMSVYVVARTIATKGTKAHKMLQNAFEKNQQQIMTRIERAVSKISKEAGG